MPYNDTSGKTGLIQDCEFWTNLGDGTISGDTALKARFTALMNIRYSTVLAQLQILSGTDGAEDRNYADQQFSTFSIVSGQNDYEFLTDEDGNTISDFTGVHIKKSTETDYTPLDRLTFPGGIIGRASNDPLDMSGSRFADAQMVMSPNTSNTGTPTAYLERGSQIFFDVVPDFSGTGKLFYRLVPSYFTTSDTTKTPGFIDAAHRLLSLGASHDWLSVNKSENQLLLTRIEAETAKTELLLETYTRQKNPTRSRMTGAVHSTR